MKRNNSNFLTLLSGLALFIGLSSQASAGTILTANACQLNHVTAAASNADACLGIYGKTNPGAGPNDSEGFFNGPLAITGGWGAGGAFGINTWSFLGKDEQSSQAFIDMSSGDPATWSVAPNSLIAQPYLIAIKQSTELALYKFDSLLGAQGGTIDVDAIFGSGTDDQGWSHVSIYTSAITAVPVPEPGILALLGLGLLGLGVVRRQRI